MSQFLANFRSTLIQILVQFWWIFMSGFQSNLKKKKKKKKKKEGIRKKIKMTLNNEIGERWRM